MNRLASSKLDRFTIFGAPEFRSYRIDLFGRKGRPGLDGVDAEILHTLSASNWRMASIALAEGMLGRAFNDASALQWFLRMRDDGGTREMNAQLVDALCIKWTCKICSPKSACQLWSSITATIASSRSKGMRTGGGDSGRSVRSVGG
jgi:hypothetical protein